MSDLLLLSDLDIAARTVFGEARGESYAGKVAVARVMVNRWHTTTGQFAKDDTLATACLRHVQFSAWSIGDPNFGKMFAIDVRDFTFRECWRAVLEAVDLPVDPTGGALHYHTVDIAPSWAIGKTPIAIIGRHAFYNDIDRPDPHSHPMQQGACAGLFREPFQLVPPAPPPVLTPSQPTSGTGPGVPLKFTDA